MYDIIWSSHYFLHIYYAAQHYDASTIKLYFLLKIFPVNNAKNEDHIIEYLLQPFVMDVIANVMHHIQLIIHILIIAFILCHNVIILPKMTSHVFICCVCRMMMWCQKSRKVSMWHVERAGLIT